MTIPVSATVAANGATKPPDIKPGPPPILTKRGADILVQVEKMLDEAGKTAGEIVGAASDGSGRAGLFDRSEVEADQSAD